MQKKSNDVNLNNYRPKSKKNILVRERKSRKAQFLALMKPGVGRKGLWQAGCGVQAGSGVQAGCGRSLVAAWRGRCGACCEEREGNAAF